LAAGAVPDPDAFNAYEHGAWNAASLAYIDGFGPIRAAVIEGARAYVDAKGVSLPMPALLSCGRKPR